MDLQIVDKGLRVRLKLSFMNSLQTAPFVKSLFYGTNFSNFLKMLY